MIEYLRQMSKEVINQAPILAQVITEKQNSRYPELKILESQLLPMRESLFLLHAEALTLNEEDRYEMLKVWAEKHGKIVSMQSSVTLDAMLRELPEFRYYIGDIMRNKALELGLTAAEMYDVIEVLDTSLNEAVYYFSLQFILAEQERHQVTQSIVRELSVPIVSITDHIAVLPVIGTFDDVRVFSLQEDTLFQASKLELDHLIIDLSGLETTDTHVAQELFNLFDALRLLGIQPIVSGIKPSIALSLVQLGLSFGKVSSFATLKQALESLY